MRFGWGPKVAGVRRELGTGTDSYFVLGHFIRISYPALVESRHMKLVSTDGLIRVESGCVFIYLNVTNVTYPLVYVYCCLFKLPD